MYRAVSWSHILRQDIILVVLVAAAGMLVLSTCGFAGAKTKRPVLMTGDGKPLMCIYFFGHWWEPWKSDDEAIRRDLKVIKDLGFNTLLLDHEFSQMLDGNWKWLDREHRLAREMGFYIVPWLEAHCGRDIVAADSRIAAAKDMFGIPDIPVTVDQNGNPTQALVTSEAFKQYMISYASAYLDRYLEDGALLRVMVDGKPRPVISLSVEMDFTAFDPDTNLRFIRWLEAKYGSIEKLNSAWHTDFMRFEDINPLDKRIFDYSRPEWPLSRQPKAVIDHVTFRAWLCNEAFADIKERLLKKYPDLLFLAEVPYPFESFHPHARSYAVMCACTPDCVRFADILLLRWGQWRPAASEKSALNAYSTDTGAKTIICYRVSADLNSKHGEDAAEIANALGYYSWNEMVDCHAVTNPPGVGRPDFHVDSNISKVILDGMKEANEAFLRR